MNPPVFEICSADPDVQTNLGSSPCRLYPAGDAPKDTSKSYATWQLVGGEPENSLNDIPDIDSFTVRFDILGTTVTNCRNAAKAIRDSIEPYAHVTGYLPESRDPDTKLFNYAFIVDWFVDRDTVS